MTGEAPGEGEVVPEREVLIGQISFAHVRGESLA